MEEERRPDDYIETFANGDLLLVVGALLEPQYPGPTDQDQRGLQRDQRQRIARLDRQGRRYF